MNVQIVPFENTHLDAAAELLAARHRLERSALPMLPPAFETPNYALAAIKAIWEKDNVDGVAAFQGNRLVGYLIADRMMDSQITEPSGWVRLAGHAVQNPNLYHDLYAVMAEKWVEQGCLSHYVMVSAGNIAALDIWFSLSFGKEQAHAIYDLGVTRPKGKFSGGITIRRATSADESIVHKIAENNVVYQTGSPVYAPVPDGYVDQVREGYVESITEDDAIFWLAEKDGEVVGYQIYYPVEADDTSMMTPAEKSIELPAGGTITTERGQGIGTALTQHAFTYATEQGNRYCLIDWRTTNILASRFWTKTGFQPTVYRLMRRLDRRVHP